LFATIKIRLKSVLSSFRSKINAQVLIVLPVLWGKGQIRKVDLCEKRRLPFLA